MKVLLIPLAFVVLIVGSIVYMEVADFNRSYHPPSEEELDEMDAQREETKGTDSLPLMLPGLTSPEMVPVSKATLFGKTKVIGIVLDGESRAYQASSFERPERSVLNDVVNGKPLSILYNANTKQIRVLTSKVRTGALPITIAGYSKGELKVGYLGDNYDQMSKELELSDHPFELMPWEEWTTAHPETLLWNGNLEHSH